MWKKSEVAYLVHMMWCSHRNFPLTTKSRFLINTPITKSFKLSGQLVEKNLRKKRLKQMKNSI